jgi:hypothetical protein
MVTRQYRLKSDFSHQSANNKGVFQGVSMDSRPVREGVSKGGGLPAGRIRVGQGEARMKL